MKPVRHCRLYSGIFKYQFADLRNKQATRSFRKTDDATIYSIIKDDSTLYAVYSVLSLCYDQEDGGQTCLAGCFG